MENVNNNAAAILLAIAIILFILWIIYLVRVLGYQRSARRKNRSLYSLTDDVEALENENKRLDEELSVANNTIDMLREDIAALNVKYNNAVGLLDATTSTYRNALKEQTGVFQDLEVPFTPQSVPETVKSVPLPKDPTEGVLSTLKDAVLLSGAHHNPDITKAELAELIHTDRKALDTVFKDKEIDWVDFLNDLRLKEALEKLAVLKYTKKEKGVETPDEEESLQQIAQECGFGKVSTLNKAVKRHYTMSLSELRKVL